MMFLQLRKMMQSFLITAFLAPWAYLCSTYLKSVLNIIIIEKSTCNYWIVCSTRIYLETKEEFCT